MSLTGGPRDSLTQSRESLTRSHDSLTYSGFRNDLYSYHGSHGSNLDRTEVSYSSPYPDHRQNSSLDEEGYEASLDTPHVRSYGSGTLFYEGTELYDPPPVITNGLSHRNESDKEEEERQPEEEEGFEMTGTEESYYRMYNNNSSLDTAQLYSHNVSVTEHNSLPYVENTGHKGSMTSVEYQPGSGSGYDQDVLSSYARLSAKSLESYFIQPMDLSEPQEDMFGYTQVCSLKMTELHDLRNSKLNKPVRVLDRQFIPSFVVRLWSRSSGRYVCILPVGSSVYARAPFGSTGHLRMLVKDEQTVVFQSTRDPRHHLCMRNGILRGDGSGGAESDFRVWQNGDGYCAFESIQEPGCYMGVRENGNIMLANHVSTGSVHAQFIIQKEAMDLL